MTVLWLLAAYAVGAIPASHLLARAGGVDLRTHGSGNVGATNLYRALGWRYALPAAVFDVAKGAVPTGLAMRYLGEGWATLAVGGAAVLGHVFPLYLRFHGGKGVATAAGVVLALAPAAVGASAVVWAAVVLATGYVSLASMLAAVAFPVTVRLLDPDATPTLALGVALSVFIVFTHRSNVRRLLTGSEHRFRRPRAARGNPT